MVALLVILTNYQLFKGTPTLHYEHNIALIPLDVGRSDLFKSKSHNGNFDTN